MADEEKEREARKRRLFLAAERPPEPRTRKVTYLFKGKRYEVVEVDPHGRRQGYIFGKGRDCDLA